MQKNKQSKIYMSFTAGKMPIENSGGSLVTVYGQNELASSFYKLLLARVLHNGVWFCIHSPQIFLHPEQHPGTKRPPRLKIFI